MRLRSLLAFLLCVACFAVLGCGVSPPTGSGANSTGSSALAGNWLLGPSLPQLLSFSQPVSTAAVSFDVAGQTVTGTGVFQVACSNASFSIEFGAVITGSLQADGTFTLAFPSPLNGPSVTVSGKAPAIAGGSWTGSYTISPNAVTGCTASQLTSSFTATPMGNYTGLYTGSGTYQALSSAPAGSTGTIALNLTLMQGAALGNGTTISRLGLNASLTVTGLSCFSKSVGAAQLLNHSVAEGSRAEVALTMDDGSTAILWLDAQNPSLSSLAVDSLLVSSGNCAGNYLFLGNRLLLTRQ